MSEDIHAIIDQVIEEPTLDKFLDRHPRTLSEEDFINMCRRLRAERAQFIKADSEKKSKKELA